MYFTLISLPHCIWEGNIVLSLYSTTLIYADGCELLCWLRFRNDESFNSTERRQISYFGVIQLIQLTWRLSSLTEWRKKLVAPLCITEVESHILVILFIFSFKLAKTGLTQLFTLMYENFEKSPNFVFIFGWIIHVKDKRVMSDWILRLLPVIQYFSVVAVI